MTLTLISQTLKKELTEFINKTSLGVEDKELWNRATSQLQEPDAQTLLETLREDPQQLTFLTENLKKKLEAFKNDDDTAWDNIIEEEKAYLEKL